MSAQRDDQGEEGQQRGGRAPASGEAVRDRFTSDEVFRRVVATAEEEVGRGAVPLLASGFAAGLTAGVSILASAPVVVRLGGGQAAQLIGALGYSLGFVLIVIGRYQLYTENTLTPVMLVLGRQTGVGLLLRLWGLVLSANLVGSAVVAGMLHLSGVFDAPTAEHVTRAAVEGLEEPWPRLFWTSVFAGGLVATMVWLVMAVRESSARVLIVILITSVIPAAKLHHCVFGSAESLFAVYAGASGPLSYLRFLALTVLGNTVGGVVLVALLNYAQTREAEK